MNVDKHLLQNTTLILLAVMVALLAGLSMVTYADEHEDYDVVEYDVDDMEPVEVPFGHGIHITADGISADETYELHYNNEYEMVESDEDEAHINLSPETLSHVGHYEVLDVADAMISVSEDEETDGESVVIDEVSANVDGLVVIYDEDEEQVATEEIDAETLYEHLLVSDVEGEEDEPFTFKAVVYDEDENELASSDEVTHEYDAEAFDSHEDEETEGANERFMAEFSVVENDDVYDRDAHVYHDKLDGDNLGTIWMGHELVLTDSEEVLEVGEDYRFEYVDGDTEEFIEEVRAVESDAGYNAELHIETDTEFGTGQYQVTDGDDVLTHWSVQEQTLSVEADETFINLNTDSTSSDLSVESNRNGPYDLFLSAESVDSEDVYALIDEDELFDSADYELEDDEHVRIMNVETTDEFIIPLDFESADDQMYDFHVEVADSTAHDNESIEAAFDAQGSASFDQGTYSQDRGDMVQMTIGMEATDEAVFRIAEDDYDVEFTVVDGSGDEEVDLLMDTYQAGEGGTIDEVFSTVDDDDFIVDADELELPSVSGDLSTGLYTLELEVGGDEADLSTLEIEERSSTSISTWVMPNDRQASMSDLEEYGYEQDNVAEEDWFVVEVEASGIFSNHLLTNDTHPAALVDLSERSDVDSYDELAGYDGDGLHEFNLHIEESDPARHAEPTTLRLEQAEELEINPSENKFYAFFDTSDEDVFDTFDEEFDANPTTDYDIHFNVTDDYRFASDDGNGDDLFQTVEIVDREVVPQLPSVTVDEEDLDTRFGLTVHENSTVTGETYVAPGTEVSVRVRSEGVNPILFRETAEVDEDGMISAEYDLSEVDVDREMTVQFFPLSDREDAVMIEPDVPPEIVDIDVNTPVITGEEVEFNPEIEDADEMALSYNWDFGDGDSSAAPVGVNVYDEPGTYNATLEVTDAADQSDEHEVEIVVEEAPNQPPSIEDLIGPSELEVGETANFGVVAIDDTDQDDLTYSWDFDDGTTATGVSASHSFGADGVYDVEVTVTDTEGESTTETHTVQVEGDAPDVGDDEEDEAELTVEVVDEETDEPIPGIAVGVEQDGENVDGDNTNDDGIVTFNLDHDEYEILVTAEGYEDFGAPVDLDEDMDITANMVAEGDGDDDGDDDDDPDQPGFTLLIAALAVIGATGYVYYRRQVQG